MNTSNARAAKETESGAGASERVAQERREQQGGASEYGEETTRESEEESARETKVRKKVHVSNNHGAQRRHRREAGRIRTRLGGRGWVARTRKQGLRERRENERVARGARDRRNKQRKQQEVCEGEE